MGAYLRSVGEMRPHLPVPAPLHTTPCPATGRWEHIPDKPTSPDHSNPRILAHLNGTGGIRVQSSVPAPQGEQEPRDTLLSLGARAPGRGIRARTKNPRPTVPPHS